MDPLCRDVLNLFFGKSRQPLIMDGGQLRPVGPGGDDGVDRIIVEHVLGRQVEKLVLGDEISV